TGAATDPNVSAHHGLTRSTYEGPTGIVGVLHTLAGDDGLDAVSLWAGVPHYLAATTYLAGAVALVERASRLLQLDVPLEGLARDAASQLDDITQVVRDEEELAAYVGELEERVDDQDEDVESRQGTFLPPTPVSGEQLAAEFERYLRDRGGDS
ncbi:MAG: PAC2 family protein, partial [Actinobacteria bacterium]|nr:PAC2 family protein [Actinomycetota bacterium]